MKHHYLILLLVSCSCAAPISYVNNLPKSSGLEEKDDVNLNVNIGSDTRGRDKIVQAGIAWSPIKNFGLDFEYSGLLKLERHRESLDKARYMNGSLIYYHVFPKQNSLEFKASIGRGSLFGLNTENGITIFNPIFTPDSYLLDVKYQTLDLQINYNFYIPNESTRATIGFRGRRANFSKYQYIIINNDNPSRSFERDGWKLYLIDPFIEVNQEIGEHLSFNSRISHTFFNGTERDGFRHPFHKRLGISLGLVVRL